MLCTIGQGSIAHLFYENIRSNSMRHLELPSKTMVFSSKSLHRLTDYYISLVHVTVTTLTFDEEMELVGTEEFENMPCFPDAQSIQKINGIWVIKING